MVARNTGESDSAVLGTPGSPTLRPKEHRGVRLCGVRNTGESDSAVLGKNSIITVLNSFTENPQCEKHKSVQSPSIKRSKLQHNSH